MNLKRKTLKLNSLSNTIESQSKEIEVLQAKLAQSDSDIEEFILESELKNKTILEENELLKQQKGRFVSIMEQHMTQNR